MDYIYTLTIELLEELHSGTGTGTLIIDRLQARDETGRPVINASHLKGVWRDNAERLRVLDQYRTAGSNSLTDATIKQLFGDPKTGRGKLLVRSLRVKDGANTDAGATRDGKRTPGHTGHEWATADTLTWEQTARRPGSRVPEDDSLRRTEHVPAGTEFTGKVILRHADPALKQAFERIVKFTDRLGSERSRGSGLIRILSFTPKERPSQPSNKKTSSKTPAQVSVLRLLLRNQEPVCIPRTGFPGNIIDSETHIPGRALLGALCQRALDRDQKDLARKLLAREFSIGNAYPLPPNMPYAPGEALAKLTVLPIPLNLYSIKEAAGKGTDSLWPHWCDFDPSVRPLRGAPLRDELEPNQDPTSSAKRPGANTYLNSASLEPQWWLHHMQCALAMRNRRGPPIGTVKRSDTELFTIEQIPANTWFVADIGCLTGDPQASLPALCDELLRDRSELRLGRGGAPITIEAGQLLETLPLEHFSRLPTPGQIQITLVSDLLARTSNLGFHRELGIAALRDVLPEGPGNVPIDWSSLGCDGVKTDFELHRGFNAATGLHRPPVMVIRRGSVIRLSGQGVEPLRALLQSRPALGERAWEGYGRYIIDFHPLQTTKSPDHEWGDNRPEPDGLIGAREKLVNEAEQYRIELLQASVTRPSRSQWFQLLDAVDAWGHSSATIEPDKVSTFLENALQKKSGDAWKSLHSPPAGVNRLVDKLPKAPSDARLFVEALISVMRSGDDGQ